MRPHDAALNAFLGDRLERAENLDLLVADGVGVERDGRLHRDEAQQVHYVVLYDVAERPGLFVICAAALDADLLGHRDLHVIDVLLVPDRLEDAVGEPQHEQVLHRLLAEVVVDAEDLVLGEATGEFRVERLCGFEVCAERLLDDDPRPRRAILALPGQARESKLIDDGRDHVWRDGQVEEAAGDFVAGGELLAEAPISVGVVIVRLYVADSGRELRPGCVVERAAPSKRLDPFGEFGPETFIGLLAPCEPDHGKVVRQEPLAEQTIHGGDELAAREVAGRAEDRERERLRHCVSLPRLRRRPRRGQGRVVVRMFRDLGHDLLVHERSILADDEHGAG